MDRNSKIGAGIAAAVVVTAGAIGIQNANQSDTTTVKGRLLVAVTMPGTVPVSQVQASILESNGDTTSIDVSQSLLTDIQDLSGEQVKVEGIESDGIIQASNIEPTTAKQEQASAPAQMKVAYVFMNRQVGTPSSIVGNPWTTADLTIGRTNFFTGAFSTAAWMRENSNGQTIMTGEVFGPYQEPGPPATAADCEMSSWLAKAKTYINDSSFTHVVAVVQGQGCAFAGIAYVGWPGVMLNGYIGSSTSTHELGHNLGVWHAGAVAANAQFYDYGDPYDVMGSGNNRHMNAYHKELIGWLPSSKIRTVSIASSSISDFNLGSSENPIDDDIEEIKVGNWSIDRRSSSGFDTFNSNPGAIFPGVWIHGTTRRGTSDTWVPLTTPCANPADSSCVNKPLLPGQSFVNGDITIKTISDDQTLSTAHIQVCVISCNAPPPTTTTTNPGPTTTTTTTVPPPGSSFGYQTGDDSDDVGGYASFKLGQTFTPTVSTQLRNSSVLVFRKGSTGTMKCSITTTTNGLPTNTILASGSNTNINTTKTWTPCAFSVPVSVTAGVQYALILSWTGGNGSNVLIWRTDITSPTYVGGSALRSRSSGAWDSTSIFPTRDRLFQLIS